MLGSEHCSGGPAASPRALEERKKESERASERERVSGCMVGLGEGHVGRDEVFGPLLQMQDSC